MLRVSSAEYRCLVITRLGSAVETLVMTLMGYIVLHRSDSSPSLSFLIYRSGVWDGRAVVRVCCILNSAHIIAIMTHFDLKLLLVVSAFIETGSYHRAKAGLSFAILLPQPSLGAGRYPFQLFLFKNRMAAELCGSDHSSGTVARTDSSQPSLTPTASLQRDCCISPGKLDHILVA